MDKNTGGVQSASLVLAPTEKSLLSCFRTYQMPPLENSSALKPLCHEHHLQMRLTQVPLQTGSEPTQALVYACPEPDCFVNYNSSRGYFIVTDKRNGTP
jgi:hypothetical protein